MMPRKLRLWAVKNEVEVSTEPTARAGNENERWLGPTLRAKEKWAGNQDRGWDPVQEQKIRAEDFRTGDRGEWTSAGSWLARGEKKSTPGAAKPKARTESLVLAAAVRQYQEAPKPQREQRRQPKKWTQQHLGTIYQQRGLLPVKSGSENW
jgi:hypothetical protein